MTDTIPNVPRELKPCPFCGGEPNLTTADYVHDDLTPMPVVECKSCSAWVQADDWNTRAPSPAGVDGLEVETFLHTLHMELGQTEQFCSKWKGDPFGIAGEDYSSTYAVTSDPLCRLADAQAIIDGLRGENEALHAQVKVLQSDANSWQSGYDEGRRMGGKHCALTIDQHAQRIGELEGLLRHAQKQVPTGSWLHMRIDAALAAVCAAAPNIAPTSEHSGS